jgi:hypothetical protein
LSCLSVRLLLRTRRAESHLANIAILGILLMRPIEAQAQAVPVYDAPSPSMLSDLGIGQTRVIPALSVSERYDSNVWYGFTPPQTSQYDYVSNVAPEITISHRGKLVEGTLTGMAVGEFYTINSGLNYVGANGGMNFNLDNLVQQLNRRLTLSVADQLMYTNQLQAFIIPTPGQTPAFSGSAVGSGVQAFRTTTMANTGKVDASYRISPGISLRANYINTLIDFSSESGNTSASGTQAQVFGIEAHSLKVGPELKISPRDTVGVNYTYSIAKFNAPSASLGSYSTQGGELKWARAVTPTLTANFIGGASVLGGVVGSNLVYTMTGSLLWNYEDNSAFTISYTRSVVPSFYIIPVPLVSNVVSFSALYRPTAKVNLTASANYAHNEDTESTIRFASYGGTVALQYILARNLSAMVSYAYFNYDSEITNTQIKFDRNVVTLRIRVVLN